MKAKTELFLYVMSWHMSKVMRPSYRKLNEGFECWAYRNGFLKQIHRLEAQGFLERHPEAGSTVPFVRLTEAGRAVVTGNRDPKTLWARKWDRSWRLFLFDLPAKEQKLRREMLSALRAAGCGCLQGSVWIACDMPRELKPFLKNKEANPASLMVLESKAPSMDVARRMVIEAWDFDRLDRLYLKMAVNLNNFPAEGGAKELLEWARIDMDTWKEIVRIDPFLPKILWPDGYDAPEIVQRRESTHALAAQRVVELEHCGQIPGSDAR